MMHEAQRVQRHSFQILDMSVSTHARRQIVAWCRWASVPAQLLADVLYARKAVYNRKATMVAWRSERHKSNRCFRLPGLA